MKKHLLMIALLLLGLAAGAQVAVTTIKVAEPEHNFGTFKEEAGPQSHDFYIANTGTQPLVIQNVVASCGCTATDWTKQPIPAGSRGKVTATYDPKDRPGRFDKTVTVYTNTKPEITVLTIKATFNSGGYQGKVTKAIYVYANDPLHSEVVLMLTADVEQPAGAASCSFDSCEKSSTRFAET
ncbi:MAG TPA: DUF1573 domain-containing protein [Bacteroidales bacterium]|nr:DUF1573 domain-containing protein [Bacteroidales bacterium]